MMKHQPTYFLLLILLLLLSVSSLRAQRQVYVLYLGEHIGDKSGEEIEKLHVSYLHRVGYSDEDAREATIYSYKNSINGFSALLTPDEADAISEMDGVVSVFRSQPCRLQTTRSWEFIDLLEANWDASKASGSDQLLEKAGYGQNVTVAMIDSGVWPESESFSDTGMEPIPAYWKGTCQSGDGFNSSHCNRKLVGARFYLRSYEAVYGPIDPTVDFRSPRDVDGHGTHTASTVGGRSVPNAAALGGIGNGTARGGAPLVRLAVYKACWPVPRKALAGGNICLDDDVLAAFDDAIADGVQVISISVGEISSRPYTEDPIAIGALHAAKHNIVVAAAGGNFGPEPYTISNVAPWIITVGASSIDRVFSSPLQIGNGIVLKAQSVTPFLGAGYPLVYAGDAEVPHSTTPNTTGLCLAGTLSPSLVKGKIVLCLAGGGRGMIHKALEVQAAGGVAVVLENEFAGIGVVGLQQLIPATVLLSDEKDRILNYTATNRAPTAVLIPPTTLLRTEPAPFMAPFTSRGPSAVDPNILKPDITAPGLNIVAAWSDASSPLNLLADKRVIKYKVESGTSMSCPHVSAVAALLKAIHPDWSSAAIRSALITSGKLTNNQGKPITDAEGYSATPFQLGAGHIQPSVAADPGLVYDASYEDYLVYLCSISGGNQLDPFFTCPKDVPPPSSLNYPSLAIARVRGSMTVMRTVTNVGPEKSVYSVTINQPAGYKVEIVPTVLSFNAVGEKLSFEVTVEADRVAEENAYAFGSYVWSDGTHRVMSPLAVSTAP